jgi:hypothetical protein
MPRCDNKKCNEKFKAIKFLQKYCLKKECRELENQSKIEKLNSYNQGKEKKPIKKVSDSMAKALKTYNVLAPDFKKNNPFCECCGKETQDVHHKKGRKGVLLNDFTFCMAVCRRCHTHIHDNPRDSEIKGWLIPNR